MVGMASFTYCKIGRGRLALVALRCRHSCAGLSKGKTSVNLQLSSADKAGAPEAVSRQERQLTVCEALQAVTTDRMAGNSSILGLGWFNRLGSHATC